MLEQDRAPLLFNLVFGEGVINDATTVALLHTVQVIAVSKTLTETSYHRATSTPRATSMCMYGQQDLCLLRASTVRLSLGHPECPPQIH